MPSPRTKPSKTSLVAFAMLLPVVYVLSYAPVMRVCGRTLPAGQLPPIGVEVPPLADASLYPAYHPVDWLIDNTPLRKPLFWWADLWGVGDYLRYNSLRHAAEAMRAQIRRENRREAERSTFQLRRATDLST